MHDARDALHAALAARGIQTMMHYPSQLHHCGVFRDSHANVSMPRGEAAAARCLSLAIGPHLSDEEVRRVIAAVRTEVKALAA